MQPISVKKPLYMVGMDLIGSMKTTMAGNNYVLTMTDYFTKFVDFFPLKDKSAAEVCKGIRSFIYR